MLRVVFFFALMLVAIVGGVVLKGRGHLKTKNCKKFIFFTNLFGGFIPGAIYGERILPAVPLKKSNGCVYQMPPKCV